MWVEDHGMHLWGVKCQAVEEPNMMKIWTDVQTATNCTQARVPFEGINATNVEWNLVLSAICVVDVLLITLIWKVILFGMSNIPV
jgi:hypothetical protein